MVQTVGVNLHTAKMGRTVFSLGARTRETALKVQSASPSLVVSVTVPAHQDSMFNLMERVQTSMNVYRHLDLVVLVPCVKTRLDLSAVFVLSVPQEIRTLVSAQPTKPNAPETTTADQMRNALSRDSVSAHLHSSLTLQMEGNAKALVRDLCAG